MQSTANTNHAIFNIHDKLHHIAKFVIHQTLKNIGRKRLFKIFWT